VGPGGGKGAGMVYMNGKIAGKLDNARMVDEIVGLVEAKAAELEAARAADVVPVAAE
jgi:(E)-4-hydroxy-3-methylbut-2-enyl-diphosphate synthase